MALGSVAEFAALFRIPKGTLYRWAKEDGWARYGSVYRRFYEYDQVAESYARRRLDIDTEAKDTSVMLGALSPAAPRPPASDGGGFVVQGEGRPRHV